MNPPKPETVLPLLAVSAWKHRAFIAAQAAVVRLALEREWFSPGDVPEDAAAAEADKQGVLSNCWNMLRSLEIIERVPTNWHDEAAGICFGRIRNKRGSAKGRWTAVYRLKSRSLAEAWLTRNHLDIELAQVREQVQQEMAL